MLHQLSDRWDNMSISNNKILAKVVFADIRNMFGVSGTKLGALIQAATPYINHWAKYKPVRYATIGTGANFNHTTGKWTSMARWWKADGKCGFSISVFSELGDPSNSISFLYKLKNGQLEWIYQPPTGGSSQPFRLSDFAHYFDDAVNPVGDIGATDYWLTNQQQFTIEYDLDASDEDNLMHSDIEIGNTTLADFYLGLFMWNSNSYNVITSSTKLGIGDMTINIQAAQSWAGSWNIIPFYSDRIITLGGNFETGVYLSANIQTPTTITIHKAGTQVQIVIQAQWTSTTEITLTGEVRRYITGPSQTITNIGAYLVTTDDPTDNPAEGTTVSSVSYDDVTIGSGTASNPAVVALPTKQFTNITRDTTKTYWIGGSASNFATFYDQVEEADTPVE